MRTCLDFYLIPWYSISQEMMMNDIRLSLRFLNKSTFENLKWMQAHNPHLLEMMNLPKVEMDYMGRDIDKLDALKLYIDYSINNGVDHYDLVLGTIFNLIVGAQQAVYKKYSTDLVNNRITKDLTSLLQLYCETRRECDSVFVQTSKSV